jgi:hypothetical protein
MYIYRFEINFPSVKILPVVVTLIWINQLICSIADETPLTKPEHVCRLFMAFFSDQEKLEKFFKLNW